MYFTVARLSSYDFGNLFVLTVNVPSIPLQLIRNSEELGRIESNTQLLRIVGANGWLLLDAYDDTTAEGNYEFVITLLVRRLPRTMAIMQVRYNECFPYLVIGQSNPNTNSVDSPCLFYDLRTVVNREATTAARDYIKSLPHVAYPPRNVESWGGSV